jgi:hypothetical protein
LIWQKDREEKYVAVNKAFCHTIGFSEKDILGKTDHDLFPPQIADQFRSDDRRILNTSVPEFGIEERFQKASGESGWNRLDDFGLVAALEWQAQEFATKTGIPCRFRSTVRKLNLKADRSIAVFRIFQEALTNVARHSQATRVEASLKKDAMDLVLTIRDNGRGISEQEIAHSQSLGLVGMRERALIFGGAVAIQGKEGKGTSVVLRLPADKQ